MNAEKVDNYYDERLDIIHRQIMYIRTTIKRKLLRDCRRLKMKMRVLQGTYGGNRGT
jgi:hypothetical protein